MRGRACERSISIPNTRTSSPGRRRERADILSYDEDSIAELFYTSGSTGTPKGVMLSHRTVYMHAMAVAGTFNQDDNGVELHTIPLFHANGWGRPQTSTMMGLKQVMVRRFDPAHGLPADSGRKRPPRCRWCRPWRTRC